MNYIKPWTLKLDPSAPRIIYFTFLEIIGKSACGDHF